MNRTATPLLLALALAAPGLPGRAANGAGPSPSPSPIASPGWAESARDLAAARRTAVDAWSHLSAGDSGWTKPSADAAAALLTAADQYEASQDALSAALLAKGMPPAASDRHSSYLAAHRARRAELAAIAPAFSGAGARAAADRALAVLADAAPPPSLDAETAIQVRHVRRLPPRDASDAFKDLADVSLGPDPSPMDSRGPAPEIAAAAKAIDPKLDPPAIAARLRAMIELAPFHSEAGGASGCLRTRRCSSFDAALLLSGLLRARGVPARLAYGTVEADGAAIAMRILGGGSPQEALDALALGGVPAEDAGAGRIRFEHVWVRARAGDAWIDLDPSFDPAARGIALAGGKEPPKADPAALLVRYLSDPSDRTPLGFGFLPAPSPVPSATPLPAPKPLSIVTRGGEIADTPLAYRDVVGLTISTGSKGADDAPLVDLRVPLGDVLSTGVLLYPAPPDELGRRIESALGGPDAVPPHLVTTTTIVSAGGREIAALPPLAWGQGLAITITLLPPNGDPIDVDGRAQAGAPAAITVVPFVPGSGWLPERWKTADADPTGASGLARLEAATGAQFFADLLDETGRLAARAGGRRFVSPSAVVVAGVLDAPAGLARAPLYAKPAGIAVDVGRLDEILLTARGAQPVAFEVAAGAALSAWEARALTVATGIPAVSTVSAAKSGARAGGIAKAWTSPPPAKEMAGLSPAARAQITSALKNGRTLVLPRVPQSAGSWVGESYVLLDPRSGRGAWLIRGGYRGALTTDPAAAVLDAVRGGGDPGPVLASWRRGRAGRALLAREGWPAGASTGISSLLSAAAVRESSPVPDLEPWPPTGGRSKSIEIGAPIALAKVGPSLWMGRSSRVLDPSVARIYGKGTGFDPKTGMWIGPTALAIVPDGKEPRLLPIPARY